VLFNGATESMKVPAISELLGEVAYSARIDKIRLCLPAPGGEDAACQYLRPVFGTMAACSRTSSEHCGMPTKELIGSGTG
jgi:hypothetical protein